MQIRLLYTLYYSFLTVQHIKPITIQHESEIDNRDIDVILKLYLHQTALIRIEDQTSEEFNVKRDVHQCCILVLTAYSEELFEKALYSAEQCLIVKDEIINNLRNADSAVFVTDLSEGHQNFIERVATVSEKCKM